MLIREALLPEFDHETANTRRVLERVPMEKGDWKPHPKSSTMAALATHLAMLPSWIVPTIQQDSIDLATDAPPSPATTTAELLALFERSVAQGRAALAAADNQVLMEPWSLRRGDQFFSPCPRWPCCAVS